MKISLIGSRILNALPSGCSLRTNAKIAAVMIEAGLEYPAPMLDAQAH